MFRILSSAILLAIILLVLSAYFRMDQYFNSNDLKEHSVEFQLFVWGIILLSTGSFFISWGLILNSNATEADKKDNLKNEISDIKTKNEQIMEFQLDIKSIFNDNTVDFSSDEFVISTISKICRALELDLAVSFRLNKENKFENWINYALYSDKKPDSFNFGDGLHGQAALDKKPMHIKDIPENYLKITSGSGHILPKNVFIIPIVINDKTEIIIEFADMKSIKNNSFELLQNFAKEYSIIIKG